MEEECEVNVLMAQATTPNGKNQVCKVTLKVEEKGKQENHHQQALSPTRGGSLSSSPSRMKGVSPPHVSPLKNALAEKEEKAKTPPPSPLAVKDARYSPLKQGLERRLSGGLASPGGAGSPMREAFEVAAAFETGKSPPSQKKAEEDEAAAEAFHDKLKQFKLFSGETKEEDSKEVNQVNLTAAQYEKNIQKPTKNKPAKSILERMKMFEK